jgi:tetratricopeptide (TPR) repeat protein
MRLNYRLLGTTCFVWVILGLFCLHSAFCFADSDEELNRKARELFALGIQAERQEKNSDAEKIYEQCLRFAKENNISHVKPPVLHRLAILKAKEQKNAESEYYFRESLKLDKENTALLCDFAKLYSDQKNYANAETILKNALLIAPDHRRTLFNLGFIIALQHDRQTEGLRYLKLAIGEAAAYQELAKIYRQQGNNAQAEFAEQRATLIQKSQPSPSTDTMTSPNVPMDAQTKKELIQHVKEELLRLETAEIAATIQTETVKTTTPQPEPLSTEHSESSSEPFAAEPLATKPVLTEPLSTEPLAAEPSVTKLSATKSSLAEPVLVLVKPLPTKPPLAEEPISTEPLRDPFLVAEPQKIEDFKQNQSFADNIPTTQESFLTPIVDQIEPSPVETNSNIGEELPEKTKPFQTFSESPKQQVLKILKPEPLNKEPVKKFPQNIQSSQKADDIRTLPATDFRISNSTEGDVVLPQQPEIRTLTIVPLDNETTNKSIPEYTAISVRKIPLTEKTSAPPQTEEKKIPVSTKTEKKEEKILG